MSHRTLVDLLPVLAADAHLDLPPSTAAAQQQVSERICSPDFDAWSAVLASVGNCARPFGCTRSERGPGHR